MHGKGARPCASTKGPCRHRHQHILVIGGSCTCEVTVLTCQDCGKYLSEPDTDC